MKREQQNHKGLDKFLETHANSDAQILLDAVPFYAMLVDASHRILLVNKAAQREPD